MPPLAAEALGRIALGLPAFDGPAERRWLWCKVERKMVAVDDLRQRRLAMQWLYAGGYLARAETGETGTVRVAQQRGVSTVVRRNYELKLPRITDAGRGLLASVTQN